MIVPPTLVARGGNQALSNNPPDADLHISTHGSDWLWAAFAFIAVCFLAMGALSFLRPRGKRLFHQLGMIVLLTTTISYFSMASDLGSTPIVTEFRAHGETRQIWYVRYIQWFITFPLLLLEVLLTSGVSLSDVFATVFAGEVLVISGLVGSLVASSYKWGYFVFGMMGLFYVWYMLLWHAPRRTFAQEGALRASYLGSSGYLAFMLIAYPICWALAEGSNVITPTSEMIWYGILDIIAGPVFLFFFLFMIRDVDYSAFGLRSGKYTDVHVTPSKAAEAGRI